MRGGLNSKPFHTNDSTNINNRATTNSSRPKTSTMRKRDIYE